MLTFDRLGVRNPELRDVARQESVEHPVDQEAELAVESGKLRRVHAAPEKPRGQPGDADAEDLGDRIAAAERGQLPEPREGERAGRAAAERRQDVRGTGLGLAKRVLGGRGRRRPVCEADQGAVTESPYAIARGFQVLVHRNAAMLGDGQRGDDRVRSCRNRRDARRCRDRFGLLGRLVLERHAARRHRPQADVQADVDPAFRQHLLGIAGKRLGQLGQDPRVALQEDEPDPMRVDRRIGADRVTQEVLQLGDALDARKAAPATTNVSSRRRSRGVLDGGFFETADDVIPQRSASPRCERNGMLGTPGIFDPSRRFPMAMTR
jgi:hypothetical protein